MNNVFGMEWLSAFLPSVIGMTAVAGVFLMGVLKKLADEKAKKKPAAAREVARRKR